MTVGRVESPDREGVLWPLQLMGRVRPEGRFLAIWVAFALLLAFSAVFAPASLSETSRHAILPFAAFLAIAAMGQTLVIMTGGIDLSTPAVMTMVGVVLLSVSGGTDAQIVEALSLAVLLAAAVGLCSGTFVAIFRLNPLVVTMAVGTVVSGATLWYRTGIQQESRVPPSLASFGASDGPFAIPWSFYAAVAIMLLLTLALRYSTIGRRFTAAGANPGAAWIAGIPVQWYTMGAYVTAAALYGVAGILLSAFIRNPTLELGNPYLLAPIAAAVLGGTALSGGVGSMVAVMGAALFLTQLGQALRVMGLSTAWQFIIQGIAIAAGMALANFRWPAFLAPGRFWGRFGRPERPPARADSAPTSPTEEAAASLHERAEGE